jgi:conjugative transfer signal peptidase TraF
LTAVGVAGLGFGALTSPAPRLVWNASASAPLGLYWVTHEAIARGDFVLAEPPEGARRLAAARGYLPAHIRLVKRVAGLAGDTVCAVGNVVWINGRRVADRLDEDSRGRPLPAWQGCWRLDTDELFLLMEGIPDSFDGRYFGPIQLRAVVGKLLPLLTFWPERSRRGEGARDSRINKVPSDSADGFVCTSVSVTAPRGGCRHRSANPLNSLLTKPVSGEEGADRVTQSVMPLSQRGGAP